MCVVGLRELSHFDFQAQKEKGNYLDKDWEDIIVNWPKVSGLIPNWCIMDCTKHPCATPSEVCSCNVSLSTSSSSPMTMHSEPTAVGIVDRESLEASD